MLCAVRKMGMPTCSRVSRSVLYSSSTVPRFSDTVSTEAVPSATEMLYSRVQSPSAQFVRLLRRRWNCVSFEMTFVSWSAISMASFAWLDPNIGSLMPATTGDVFLAGDCLERHVDHIKASGLSVWVERHIQWRKGPREIDRTRHRGQGIE